MNGGNKVSDNPPSVNLSWVICKSKSHPGLNYYFNCNTRESTWHLSESERSKAQTFEKVISQIDLEKCSEPKNPPRSSKTNTPRIYNKQIINNQYPNQLQSEIMYMPNMTAGSSGMIPKIWNTPPNTGLIPGQQFFLVPGTLIPYSQPVTYGTPNIDYQTVQTQNKDYQNLEQPQRNEYFQPDEYHVTHRAFNKVNRFHNKFTRGRGRRKGTPLNKTNQLQSELPDLRHKLITNRRKSLTCKTDDEDDTDYQTDHSDAVEQNNTMNVLEETPSKYDLTKLKELNPTESNVLPWIIVVDINILLKEFQFLNRLTDAEQNCYLMVPHHVMCDLQARALNGNDRNVKRIFRFLSEKIKAELAYRGADISHQAEGVYDQTIMACVDWCKHSNVILLSDDTNFVEYKFNEYNIHIFTMNELKYVLERGPPKNYVNLAVRKSNYLRGIQITVPNNAKNKVTSESLPPTSNSDDSTALIPKKQTNENQDKVSPSKDSTDAYKLIIDNENTISPSSHTLSGEDREQPKQEGSLSTPTKTSSKMSTRMIRLNRSSKNPNNETPMTVKPRWRSRVPLNSQQKSQNATSTNRSDSNQENVHHQLSQVSMESITNESPKLPTPTTPSSDRSSLSSLSKLPKTIEGSIASGYSSSNTESKEKARIKMRSAVMYEVEGEEMEAVLRTCRDEWVTRFVQIMEEVLKQKLRDNSALHLHEAVRSVIQKYSNHFNVVDAANKLSFILSQIRDDTGNIKADIDPCEYMDMYSYGVYLVETLKDISDSCEDLDAADASLKKLLFDIKHSNHGIHSDSIIDARHDSEILNTSEHTVGAAEITEPKDSNNPLINTLNEDCSESKNCKENEEQSQNVDAVKKAIDELKKVECELTKSPQKSIAMSPQPQNKMQNKSPQADDTNSAVLDNTPVTMQPVIARNFINLPQFEERIKKMNIKDHLEDEIFDDRNASDDLEYHNGTLENSMNYLNSFCGESAARNDANFRGFVKEFVGEIRGVLNDVFVLCYDPGSRKCDGRELRKAEKAAILLNKISKCLDSILEREMKGSEHNVAALLKNANYDNFEPSEALLSQYVDIISKCKNQVDCLHETITAILKVKEVD